jgi:hypothetical protein
MYPDRTFSYLQARAAAHKIVETQMTELVAAVGGEDHITERLRGHQRAQHFEPADKPARVRYTIFFNQELGRPASGPLRLLRHSHIAKGAIQSQEGPEV